MGTDIIPLKLYKYQMFDYYALNNLRKNVFWFRKPESFNDPFDCDINFTITDINDENLELKFIFLLDSSPDKENFLQKYLHEGKYNQRFRDDIEKGAIHATNVVKEKKWRNLGVTCFSKSRDNILMWSHYADSHRGFCLEFDTGFLPFTVEKLLKVKYPKSNLYPVLSLQDIPHNLNLVETQLGTKSYHWKYEREWRLFAPVCNQEHPYDSRSLIGVYFGCKTSDENKNNIKSLVGSSIRFYEMQKSKTEFKVIAQEIFL